MLGKNISSLGSSIECMYATAVKFCLVLIPYGREDCYPDEGRSKQRRSELDVSKARATSDSDQKAN
jgi:hypothetical protein